MPKTGGGGDVSAYIVMSLSMCSLTVSIKPPSPMYLLFMVHCASPWMVSFMKNMNQLPGSVGSSA